MSPRRLVLIVTCLLAATGATWWVSARPAGRETQLEQVAEFQPSQLPSQSSLPAPSTEATPPMAQSPTPEAPFRQAPQSAGARKSLLLQELATSRDAGVGVALEGASGKEAGGLGMIGTRGRGSGVGQGMGFGSGSAGESVQVVQGAPMTGDEYRAIAENDFQAVADSPLSTLSVDVDTASYANVRRYVDEGRLPPKDAVRIEEMLNYFDYDYGSPRDGQPFAAHTEVTEAPWATGHRLVRLGIQGRELTNASTPPRNLVFLVDVSGSMQSADRLPLIQRGLDLLVDQLGAKDHVALVAYAGAAGVVLEPTVASDKARIHEAIDRLEAGGSTAGGAGIQAAYALAKANFQKDAINRVLLATDGDFNVGTTSDAELVQLIETQRESGVFLTVLGFGRGNLQDAKMEQLADKGNGNYAYIDDFSEVQKVLGEQAGGTLVTIAKDVKIQVEWNPSRVSRYRLIGYENRVLAARDFNDDHKDAGEIGAGHSVTALYEVVPATEAPAREVDPLRYQADRVATRAAAGDELLTIKLRYKEPDGDVSKLSSFSVKDAVIPFARASADTRWAAAVAGFGMLLRDSPAKGTATWALVADLAREALGPDPGGYRAEMVRLVAKARTLKAG
jgi:Ca-activated chloride channel family protein